MVSQSLAAGSRLVERMTLPSRPVEISPTEVLVPRAIAERRANLELTAAQLSLNSRTLLNFRNAGAVPWEELVKDPAQPFFEEHQARLKFGPLANRVAYWANNCDVRADFLKLVSELECGEFAGNDTRAFIRRLARLHRLLLTGESQHSYYRSAMFYRGPAASPEEDIARISKAAGKILHYGTPAVADRSVRLFINFCSALTQAKTADVTNFYKDTALFYRELMRGDDPRQDFLFVYGNESLGMNMVNGLLRLRGLQGVPHGTLESAARWLPEGEYLKIFAAAVNPP